MDDDEVTGNYTSYDLNQTAEAYTGKPVAPKSKSFFSMGWF